LFKKFASSKDSIIIGAAEQMKQIKKRYNILLLFLFI